MVTGACNTVSREVLAGQSNAPVEREFSGSNQPPQTIDRATRSLNSALSASFCSIDRAIHEHSRPRNDRSSTAHLTKMSDRALNPRDQSHQGTSENATQNPVTTGITEHGLGGFHL